jgi:hypothetical protein
MQTTSRRGMIGLDLGRKSRHEVVVLDDMQKFLMKGSLSSTGNLQRLLTAARKHSRGGEIHVVMEATGMSVAGAHGVLQRRRVSGLSGEGGHKAADFRRYLSKGSRKNNFPISNGRRAAIRSSGCTAITLTRRHHLEFLRP